MKNKKMLNEELNRMKKLSGLLKESEGDFGIDVGQYLTDSLDGQELEAALDYLEANQGSIEEFIQPGGGGVESAGRYIIKKIREQPIQEFHDIHKKNIEINGKKVDIGSIKIDGVDRGDYPDFSDAFVATANFEDGTELNEDELMELDSNYGYVVHELIFDRQLYLEESEKNECMNEGVEGGVLTYESLPGKVKEYFKRNITVSVAFVKKDGSVRHMAFRRSLKAYEKSDKEKTDAQMNVLKNNNLMNVYDTNVYIKTKKETGDPALAAKSSFRNFKLENVLAFLCGGEVFDMRDNNKIKERFGEEVYNSLTSNMVSALEKDEAEGEIGMKKDEIMNESLIRGVVRGIIKDFMPKK